MFQQTGTGYAAGSIVVASGMQPRFHEFERSLHNVIVPDGTQLFRECGCDVTQNLNSGVRKMTGDWVWFLDDDHSFKPDTLLHLLRHRVPVVVPISPYKNTPWLPCVLHGPDDPSVIWTEDMNIYMWSELSGTGLLELPLGDFIGHAGMLIQKQALASLSDPWLTCGQLDKGKLQEDLMFCHELQTLGYTVYVDRDIIFDHYTLIGISAQRYEGQYVPMLKSGNCQIMLPDMGCVQDQNTRYVSPNPLKWG